MIVFYRSLYPITALLFFLGLQLISAAALQAQDNFGYCLNDLSSTYYGSLSDSLLTEEVPKIYTDRCRRKRLEELYSEQQRSIRRIIDADVLLHDTVVCAYLDKLLLRIWEPNRERFPKRPRLLLSRSSIPNAYTVRADLIIINCGFLFQARSENDLLMCIAHELGHCLSRDPENALQQAATLFCSDSLEAAIKSAVRQRYRSYSELESMREQIRFDYSKHSRTREFEADSLAGILLSAAHLPRDRRFFLRLDSMKVPAELPFPVSSDLLSQSLHLPAFPPNPEKSRERWASSTKDSLAKELSKTHPDCPARYARFSASSDERPPLAVPEAVQRQVLLYQIDYRLLQRNLTEAFMLLSYTPQTRISGPFQLRYRLLLAQLLRGAQQKERGSLLGSIAADFAGSDYKRARELLLRLPEPEISNILNKLSEPVPEDWQLLLQLVQSNKGPERRKLEWQLHDLNPCNPILELSSL